MEISIWHSLPFNIGDHLYFQDILYMVKGISNCDGVIFRDHKFYLRLTQCISG